MKKGTSILLLSAAGTLLLAVRMLHPAPSSPEVVRSGQEARSPGPPQSGRSTRSAGDLPARWRAAPERLPRPAARGTGSRADRRQIETLRQDPSPMARAIAAYSLMRPSGPASAALRSALAVERDPDTRRAIIIALGRQTDAAAADALLELLADRALRGHWLDAAAALRNARRGHVPRMRELLGRMDDSTIAEQLELSIKCALGVATIADFEHPPEDR